MIAEDPAGNTGAAYACAIADGNMKLGQLELGLEDLSSPQFGFPLALARQYDSRSQGPGDFGPGWNLPSSDVKAQMTLPLGKGWSQQPGAGAFGTNGVGPCQVFDITSQTYIFTGYFGLKRLFSVAKKPV